MQLRIYDILVHRLSPDSYHVSPSLLVPARQLHIVLSVALRGCCQSSNCRWCWGRENCNLYLILFAHPPSLVKLNRHLDSSTMMVSLTPKSPSGSFPITHLRFWHGRCIRLFFQYTAPIWLADWQCFLLFIFLTTRISASQLVRNRSNNHQCHHRWKDYKPFQQFPTYSGMTSFWSVHTIHWTSAVSPSFF